MLAAQPGSAAIPVSSCVSRRREDTFWQGGGGPAGCEKPTRNYPSNNNHVAENAHIHIDMLLSEGSKVHLDIYHSHVCVYSERNNRRPLAQLGAF